MKNRNNTIGVGLTADYDLFTDDWDFSNEKIAMLVDGNLSTEERDAMLELMADNDELRRRVSHYVRFRTFEEKEDAKESASTKEVPTALTKKAMALFKKVIKVDTESDEFEPIYINYSKSEYEITGLLNPNNNTLLNIDLQITKNGSPYKGEVYIYKGKMLYRRLKSNKDHITCDLSYKGNYHLFIKDSDIQVVDLEFDIN